MAVVIDKAGRDVLALAEQAKADTVPSKKKPVVIVSMAAEDAAFASILFEKGAAEISEGACVAAAACNADIVFYDTDDSRAIVLSEAADGNATVLIGEGSPVLREESALFRAMAGKTVRCELEERSFPTEGWNERPTLVLDAETAYWLAKANRGEEQGKLLLSINTESVELHSFALDTPLDEVFRALAVATDKPILAGGIPGKFINAGACSTETLSYTHEFDTIQSYTAETCMAETGRLLTEKNAETSCGKCVLCREGSWQYKAIFNDICTGHGSRTDFKLIEDIGELIAIGAFCDFGRDMVRIPVTLAELCKAELEAHIVRKTCPASICSAFSNYAIDPSLCDGCGDCLDECPEEAIEGKPGFISMIDESLCEKCGACSEVCPQDAIISGGKFRVPKKMTRVGRF